MAFLYLGTRDASSYPVSKILDEGPRHAGRSSNPFPTGGWYEKGGAAAKLGIQLASRKGRLVKRGDTHEQLPPGMHFAELADFSLEFQHRLEKLRANPENYFEELLVLARETLNKVQVSYS